MAPTAAQTALGYSRMWDRAKVRSQNAGSARSIASRIHANKHVYKATTEKTGVPYFVIGGLHNRESGLSFKGVLHNGEAILGTGRKTKLVPKGRGPFTTWAEAAIDALAMPPHSLHKVKRWSVERILYECERYNGLGYMLNRYGNSPYLWSWTTEYTSGKYVADGRYDANHVDKQSGVVALFKTLAEIDPDVAAALTDREASPPKDVIADATKKERAAVVVGTGTGGGAGATQVPKTAPKIGTEQPSKPDAALLPPVVAFPVVVIGFAAAIVAVVLISKKTKRIAAKWSGA